MNDGDDGPETVEWRVWPAAQYPGRTAVAAAVIVGAGAAVAWATGNVAFGVLGGVVLVLSLQAHFLPRRYRLDYAGVAVDALGWKRTRGWEQFNSYYDDKLGVMLSTFTYPSRLDSFRGVNLRWGPYNRDAILAFVAARLPRAEKPGRRRGRGREPS